MALKKKNKPTVRRTSQRQRDKERLGSTDPQQILAKAMLVNVCLGFWDGRKHDREITRKVNEDLHATSDAGRYNKQLLGGNVAELAAVYSANRRLRDAHWAQTLPWTDSGWRLLPTSNYQEYTDLIRRLIGDYYERVDAFIEAYPRLIELARKKLNGMFKAEDYPSAEALRRKFYARVDWSPLASGSDFRVQLPKDELERVAKNVEDRLVESIGNSVKDAWQRLGDAITEVRDRLGDGGKHLRESMIERLRAVADVLGRLNLTDDQQLEAVRSRVIKELTAFSADGIKSDQNQRAVVTRSVEEILRAMDGIYSPPSKEE